METKCVVCGLSMPGWPDADVTCPDCEAINFAGDALRHPPRPARSPAAGEAPRRDGLRALRPLRFVQGTWIWTPELGIEEREHGH